MGRFQPFRREDGKWDWRLLSSNGDIVATSGGQGYRDEHDVHRAIRSALIAAQEAALAAFDMRSTIESTEGGGT